MPGALAHLRRVVNSSLPPHHLVQFVIIRTHSSIYIVYNLFSYSIYLTLAEYLINHRLQKAEWSRPSSMSERVIAARATVLQNVQHSLG